jgi:hypothetical protein
MRTVIQRMVCKHAIESSWPDERCPIMQPKEHFKHAGPMLSGCRRRQANTFQACRAPKSLPIGPYLGYARRPPIRCAPTEAKSGFTLRAINSQYRHPLSLQRASRRRTHKPISAFLAKAIPPPTRLRQQTGTLVGTITGKPEFIKHTPDNQNYEGA